MLRRVFPAVFFLLITALLLFALSPFPAPGPGTDRWLTAARILAVAATLPCAVLARRLRLPAAALLLLAAGPFARAATPPDPTLSTLQAELAREQAGLVLPGFPKPFFLEYRLDDVVNYEAVANFGALTREESGHQRIVRVTVRVGSYQSDNSSAKGNGQLALAPSTSNSAADADALRYALWLATDDAYKAALRELSAKEARQRQYEQTTPPAADFATGKPVQHLDPPYTLSLDRAEWKRRIVESSGLFRTDPAVRSFSGEVQYSTSSIRAVALNRFLVNSEGTAIRTGYTGYAAAVSVGGQAADGMRLGRDNGPVSTVADQLDSAAQFRERTLRDLQSFHELRNAPLVSAEDFHGPVLFSGDASADVLDRLFAPDIEADRPDPGTAARTQGAYSSSLHARVLPAFLNVVADPTLTTFQGKGLLGSYTVDDEGVLAQTVDVVTEGKLQNFLIGREPVRDFPASNGHGRAPVAQPAHSHFGVLLVEPTRTAAPLSDQQMQARLLAFAREQNRDVYQVDTLADLAPRVLYRVHPDGSRQLVRGAVFDELDTRALRSSIAAAGGTPYLSQSLGPIPQTTIAPQLLFEDIGIKRANDEQQKLPYYAPPAP